MAELPGADPSSFPAEFVWVYGAYYALLLALVYVPTYLRLVAAGERMRGELNPLPNHPTAESLSAFHDNAKAIGSVLDSMPVPGRPFERWWRSSRRCWVPSSRFCWGPPTDGAAN